MYDLGEREENCFEQVEEGSAICGVIHSPSSVKKALSGAESTGWVRRCWEGGRRQLETFL